MVDLNLDAVNVTAAKDKFLNVVHKVIAQPTPTPPPPTLPPPVPVHPPKEDDDDQEDDDEAQTTSRPQPTPQPKGTTGEPLIYVITGAPPVAGATSAPPLIYTVSGAPPYVGPKGNLSGNASSDANLKIAPKEKSGGGSGTAVVISVAVMFCLAVVAIAVFVVRRRQSKATADAKSLNTNTRGGATQSSTQSTSRYGNGTVLDDSSANYSHMPATADLVVARADGPRYKSSASSVADHPEIAAVRIPMEKIEFFELLSRGGFGEVHRGMYKNQTVAIKRLLPERRKDMRQIDEFLGEAKLMATLEHERIVQFIGVAWDSLSEVCVVSEFMEGGDLRSVLSRWEAKGDNDKSVRRPHGFDHDKIKIALHVAHAMTYLHSMQPVILHRDLKSKNILLTSDYDAKVTDFGVSRERSDDTMTAGVGSSLWMAPEVMMGERYDDKADVFSFGVVLSELDTHLHPYSHATEPGTGRKLPDTAVLQMVALGRISVDFTSSADPEMVALGRDCVALDPKARPTAGEALHRVHRIWRSTAVSL